MLSRWFIFPFVSLDNIGRFHDFIRSRAAILNGTQIQSIQMAAATHYPILKSGKVWTAYSLTARTIAANSSGLARVAQYMMNVRQMKDLRLNLRLLRWDVLAVNTILIWWIRMGVAIASVTILRKYSLVHGNLYDIQWHYDHGLF